MQTVAVPVSVERVQVRRTDENAALAADLQVARVLAKLLDSQFDVAGFKFGLDAILGLIPVAGDTIATVAALYPVHVVNKHKLGKRLKARMLYNIAIDYFGGLIPLAGDVFDAAFKANLKNLALLEEAAAKRGVR